MNKKDTRVFISYSSNTTRDSSSPTNGIKFVPRITNPSSANKRVTISSNFSLSKPKK